MKKIQCKNKKVAGFKITLIYIYRETLYKLIVNTKVLQLYINNILKSKVLN